MSVSSGAKLHQDGRAELVRTVDDELSTAAGRGALAFRARHGDKEAREALKGHRDQAAQALAEAKES